MVMCSNYGSSRADHRVASVLLVLVIAGAVVALGVVVARRHDNALLRHVTLSRELFASQQESVRAALSVDGMYGLDIAQNAQNCSVRTQEGHMYQMETPGLGTPPSHYNFNGCTIATVDHPLLSTPDHWEDGDAPPCSLEVMLDFDSDEQEDEGWRDHTDVRERDDMPPGTVTCAIQFDKPLPLKSVRALDAMLGRRAVRSSDAFQDEVKQLQAQLDKCKGDVVGRNHTQQEQDQVAKDKLNEAKRAATIIKNTSRAAVARTMRDAAQAQAECEERVQAGMLEITALNMRLKREAQALDRVFSDRRIPPDLFPPIMRQSLNGN
jgi:hypothetical protein